MKIKMSVQQVIDGKEYTGSISDGTQEMNYNLRFTVAIPNLEEDAKKREASGKKMPREEIRSMFPLAITRSGTALKINEEQYGLLFSLLAPFVLDFHNNPQTRDSNEGLMGNLVRGEGGGFLPKGFAKAIIGMESSVELQEPHLKVITDLFNQK